MSVRIAAAVLAALAISPFHGEPEIIGPYSTTVNIALDLDGKPDAVNGGQSDSYASRIEFHPPAGYRTRILRVYGDFVAYVRSGVVTGTSEVGWGLKTTSPDGDRRVSYPGYAATPYANSFVWLQGFITPQQTGTRLPFNFDTSAGGLLGPDNIMLSQAFVALNDTGQKVHMEPTVTVVFDYERQQTERQ